MTLVKTFQVIDANSGKEFSYVNESESCSPHQRQIKEKDEMLVTNSLMSSRSETSHEVERCDTTNGSTGGVENGETIILQKDIETATLNHSSIIEAEIKKSDAKNCGCDGIWMESAPDIQQQTERYRGSTLNNEAEDGNERNEFQDDGSDTTSEIENECNHAECIREEAIQMQLSGTSCNSNINVGANSSCSSSCSSAYDRKKSYDDYTLSRKNSKRRRSEEPAMMTRAQAIVILLKEGSEPMPSIANATKGFKERAQVQTKAVIQYLQLREEGTSAMAASDIVATQFYKKEGIGSYKARCIRVWADQFLTKGTFQESLQGKHSKMRKCLHVPLCAMPIKEEEAGYIAELETGTGGGAGTGTEEVRRAEVSECCCEIVLNDQDSVIGEGRVESV